MKKVLALLVVTLVFACGSKAPEPKYTPDSQEYSFFQKLAEKAPILNPDQSNLLVKTKKFSVYTSDIMPMIHRQLGRYGDNLANIPEQYVKNLVVQMSTQDAERKLLIQEAKANNFSVTPDTVEAKLAEIYNSMGGLEAFEKQIAQSGFTVDFVRTDIENSLIVNAYLDSMVFSATVPSEQDLQEAYNADKTATVRHILMSTKDKTDEEKEQIKEEMQGIAKRARDGEDFSELAKQYSEDPGSKENGGLYENFPKGQMVKPFEDAAFNLPIGTISDPIETTFGYHVLQIIGREKETRPFDEVKDELKSSIAESGKRDAYMNKMEELKKKYKFEQVYK